MIRTFVVEDDPDVLKVNCGFVQRVAGFVVVGVARSGRQALVAAETQPVDLVLLDIGLPDMPGLDVCRALLAARTPPVDIIAVTAARDVDTVRAVFAHAVQYLIKPYSFAKFRETLEGYAALHQYLRSSRIVDQTEMDEILGRLRGSANAALPKGLSSSTHKLVIDALRNADQPMTATEIAEIAGVSRVCARRYLDHLHHQGLAVRTARYGGPGRPEFHYRWAGSEGR